MMKVPHAAALAAISLAARMTLAATLDDVTPVFTDSTAPVVGTDETFDSAYHVVVDEAGNVATISQFDGSDSDEAITLSTLSGTGYSTSIIATERGTIPSTTDTYGKFENLGLVNGQIVFASPSGQERAGLFTATGTSGVSTIFYSTSNTTGQTLNTTGSFDTTILYGLSLDGKISFGLRTNSGATSQNLYANSTPTVLDTSGIQNFNRTDGTSPYLVKTVGLSDGSVVAIAQASGSDTNSGYGLYDITATGSATPRAGYSPTIIGGYQPRQLLGATATQSIVLAVNPTLNTATSGEIIYQNGGTTTTLASGFDPGNRSIRPEEIVGEMTDSGKAAVYVPNKGIYYHDPANPNASYQLAAGATVGPSGNTQTISDFGLYGDGATPMLNKKGWIVTGAILDNGNQALIGWNPSLDIKEIIAQAGDQFKLSADDGAPTFTIDGFSELFRSDDVDITKDGLNDANQLAFGVYYEDAAGNPGNAVLTTTLVPEPASFAMLSLAGGLMLRRRRVHTPR